jgi:hypothetical protein
MVELAGDYPYQVIRHAMAYLDRKVHRSSNFRNSRDHSSYLCPVRNLHCGSHGSHDYSQEQQTERRTTHLQIRKIRGEKFKL